MSIHEGDSNGKEPRSERFRRSQTEFRKQLGWHVQQPEIHAEVMTIAPAMAQELMVRNANEEWKNRPQSKLVVDSYARQMESDNWCLTGETIVVSESGRLLNGQHRLAACIKAGTPFECLVVFGISDAAFAHMDIGKRRSAADIFDIYKVPNAAAMSSSALWLWKYQNSSMMPVGSVSMPTADELHQFYLAHEGLQQSSNAGVRFSKFKLATPSLMTALHYVCAHKNRTSADEFFEKTATGIGFLKASDPAAKLRHRLEENSRGPEKLDNLWVGAFAVQAWNAMRQNRPIKIFRWRGAQNPKESFPRIA